MIRTGFTRTAAAAALFMSITAAPLALHADESEKPGETKAEEARPEPKKEPKTTTVTKGAFSVVLELNGTLDAKRQWDLEVDTESWGGELEVIEAAQPGPVKKGDVVARFKTDKIDEALAAAERDLLSAKAGFRKQQEEAKRADEALALGLRKAEADAVNAANQLKRWQEFEKEFRLQEADYRMQVQKDNFVDQMEELTQLEKMYKADELTEETEDIVLKRTQRQIERLKKQMAWNERRDRAWRELDYAREGENIEAAAKRAAMDLERAKEAARAAEVTGKVDLEKAKVALEKQEENLAKLRRDREKFVLKSPEDGMLVRGALSRGKWSGLEEPSATLKPEGKVKPKTTLFTVVRGGDVFVRTQVNESAMLTVNEGQSASVTANALPKQPIPGKVSRVARFSAGENYDVFVEVPNADARLFPGYGVKVKVTTVENSDALTVPAGAVEKDGEKRFVHVWTGEKSERREVECGETSQGRTEIVKGASEGEKVLESAPKQK